MNFMDIIFILMILVGIYLGYNGGFYKIISDTILLFITSFLSGLLTNLLFDKVIAYLPFFNFWGASEGIKSINIIMWRVIVYVALIILLIFIINKILDKTGVLDRIDEKIISMRKWGRYLGCVFVIPLMLVLIYNVVLVVGLPIFNIEQIHESAISQFVMDNMILLNTTTDSLHKSEIYAIEQINDNNTIETYNEVNNSILSYLKENELISKDSVTKLKEDNKLTGTKSKNVEKKDSNDAGTDESDKTNNIDNSDNYEDYEVPDDNPDEDYDDGPIDDDGEYYYDDDADVL